MSTRPAKELDGNRRFPKRVGCSAQKEIWRECKSNVLERRIKHRPDALSWVRKEYESSGRMAFWLNMTQPLIAFCLVSGLLVAKSRSKLKLLLAAVVGIAYIYNVLTNAHDVNIEPTRDCTSLQYRWWQGLSSWLYCLLMIAIIICITFEKVRLADCRPVCGIAGDCDCFDKKRL